MGKVSQLESSEREGVSIAHPSRLSELHPLITVWCDADWAGDQDDRRSTSGAILQLFGSSVSWHSKKQSTVALSSAEAEYVSLSAAVTEARVDESTADGHRSPRATAHAGAL
jgi:hypothetical protein